MNFSDFKNIDDLLKRAIIEQVSSTTEETSPADFPKKKEPSLSKPGTSDLIDEPKVMTTPSKPTRPDDKVRSGM